METGVAESAGIAGVIKTAGTEGRAQKAGRGYDQRSLLAKIAE